MKIIKTGLLCLAILMVLIVILGTTFRFGWLGNLPTKTHASKQAIAALSSTTLVNFTQDQWLVFSPVTSTPTTGLIFYPCALCDARGFAPLMREIAAAGFLVALVPMPSNFAIFDTDRALEIKTKYSNIKKWVIGGHSMGGGATAMFLHGNPEAADGALFWDSYSNSDYDISIQKLPVLSIYGDHHHSPDRPAKFEQSKRFLPPHTRYQVIAGGDHFQFGSWRQEDITERNTAVISESEQQQSVIAHSIEFLTGIEQGVYKPVAN